MWRRQVRLGHSAQLLPPPLLLLLPPLLQLLPLPLPLHLISDRLPGWVVAQGAATRSTVVRTGSVRYGCGWVR